MMPPADRRLACVLAASAAAHLMVLSVAGWHARSPLSSGDVALQVTLFAPAPERRAAGSTSARRPATNAAAAHSMPLLRNGIGPVPPEALVARPSRRTSQDQSGPDTSRHQATPGDDGHVRQTEAAIQAYGQTLHDRLTQALRARFFYPMLARREGWQGAVRLLLHIEPDGRISDTQVVRTSGYAVLDDAAMRSVREIAALRVDDAPRGAAFFDLSLTVVYRLTDG
jgi:protein TonB